MSVDSISNFLTTMRNGILVRKRFVVVPFSKQKMDIAHVLKEEGYIKDYQKIDDASPAKVALKIRFKYVDGESVIHEITRISRPGRRRYEKIKNVQPVVGGLGVAILTTSSGVMTDREARSKNVGGEVLCSVW